MIFRDVGPQFLQLVIPTVYKTFAQLQCSFMTGVTTKKCWLQMGAYLCAVADNVELQLPEFSGLKYKILTHPPNAMRVLRPQRKILITTSLEKANALSHGGHI